MQVTIIAETRVERASQNKPIIFQGVQHLAVIGSGPTGNVSHVVGSLIGLAQLAASLLQRLEMEHDQACARLCATAFSKCLVETMTRVENEAETAVVQDNDRKAIDGRGPVQ